MKSIIYGLLIISSLCWTPELVAKDSDAFIGNWALTIPNGRAGWLGVTQEKGYLDGSILWGGGSVVPVASIYVNGDALIVTRTRNVDRKDSDGKVIRRHTFTETILAKITGDKMQLTQIRPNNNGNGVRKNEFTGKKTPPLPAKPDLSKVKYGEAKILFNGENLDGWKLTNSNQTNGWSVNKKERLLINRPVQQQGKPHISYGNLQTIEEFEDFNLTLEVKYPPKGNSGIYLRGVYEVQVSDTYGKPRDSHHLGGIYSRLEPESAVEKPADQWQSLDIILVDRHVTVILNGTSIINNEPPLGCTGGALWSDELRPGPIYLQGDHTGVEYRNIVLKPIIK